jgi:predicted ATP-dependent protease
MSGPAHSKGILTLSGYLSGRYALEYPLSLSATICFEQIYGQIDGDSASSAELYALLSSLADAPIKQSLAVTGSVNQRGEIQAVGSVTYKIEGFFKLCQARGLTGDQGVLVPLANVRNLMLREEVVVAIREGMFHIYAISTIDEGISILTGIPAGQPDANGHYLTGTINDRIARTLRRFAEHVRAYTVIPRSNHDQR